METRSRSSNTPMDLLQEGAAALGLKLSLNTLEQFHFYLTQLQLWNRRVNLTGLKNEQDLVIRHFLDSLAVLPFLGEPHSLADLGAGPGFPGLALKLVLPQMQLTLVEATEKKAAFLEYILSCLKLPQVMVVRTHLTGSAARKWGPRFEAVVSRAAFKLRQFFELAAPLLLAGGRALALKGPNLDEGELAAAAAVGPALGLTHPEPRPYSLPLTSEPRMAVLAYRQ